MTGVAQDKTPVVLGITLTACGATLIVVAVRIYSRKYLTKFWGLDDWFIVAAALFSVGDEALKILWCQNGLGMHLPDVSAYHLQQTYKIAYSIQIVYPISLGLVKISILTFYLRIFPQQTFRKICCVMMGLISGLTIAVSLSQALVCHPIRSAWSGSLGSNCGNKAALQYAASVLNLTTDLMVLLLPMKYLWALALEPKKRFGVIAIFSLGFSTCVVSAIRLTTIHKFYIGHDPTYDAYPISICSGIEINLGIITASLPAIKPFFLRYIYKPLCLAIGHVPSSVHDSTSTSNVASAVSSQAKGKFSSSNTPTIVVGSFSMQRESQENEESLREDKAEVANAKWV